MGIYGLEVCVDGTKLVVSILTFIGDTNGVLRSKERPREHLDPILQQ